MWGSQSAVLHLLNAHKHARLAGRWAGRSCWRQGAALHHLPGCLHGSMDRQDASVGGGPTGRSPSRNVSNLGKQQGLCIAQPANTQPSAHLQQQALLRVHEVRLRPGNAEQGRIKAVHSTQESAVPHTQLRFAGLRQRRASGAELSMMLRWTCTTTDCPASPSPNLDPRDCQPCSPAGLPGPNGCMAPGR